MALTASNPFAIGQQAPDFNLPNVVNGEMNALQDLKGEKGTVVMFICNHCPFVIHANEELVRLANDYQAQGIGFVAISSNDIVNYPDDAPEHMKTVAEKLQYPFPYLYDESQEVAKAYDAACTPDFYVFNADLEAVYHGQLDASRPGNNIAVTGQDMRAAMDRMLEGGAPLEAQMPSIGCGIKWK